MTTWRKHTFVTHARYRVLKSFKTVTSTFLENEELTFKEATYSRYDSSSSFISETQGSQLKTWFLHDDDDDYSKNLFEFLGQAKDDRS